MTLRRRSSLLAVAVVTASLLALAFAGGSMAATQNIGPYEVTDAITHDLIADTTTATYTVTVPDNQVLSLAAAGSIVQDISHVSVGVCALDGRAYDTNFRQVPPAAPVAFGSYSPSGDPSINLTTPIVKWDQGQGGGSTVNYIVTVPGQWDSAPTTLYIKSGSGAGTVDPHTAFSGTVQGIACANTPDEPGTPETPPTNTSTPVVPGQQVAGQQQVLGERVERGSARLAGASGCQRKAFKVKVSGNQIRKVTFKIDGKTVKKVSASASGKTYSITINPLKFKPGSHLVTAKATFTAASNTKAKTMRVRFARCVRTAPAFTG